MAAAETDMTLDGELDGTENRSMLRTAVNALSSYSAGRSARDAIAEHGWNGPIAPLAANEGPYGPFPSARAAIEKMLDRVNRYPESGFMSLRRALAERVGSTVDRIAVAAGGTAIIHHLSLAVLDAGDEIVLCSPTFHAYALEARKLGATVAAAPLRDDGSYDLDAMLALISDKTRLVYVCNPNNPTGGIVYREELLRFVRAVPERVVILVDEAYIEYVDSTNFPDTMSDPEFHLPNLISLRTFSKAYGLAGLRVGYAMAAPGIIDALTKIQSNYEVTAPSLAAALASLNEETELARRVAVNKTERDKLFVALTDLGFDPIPSHANFIAFKVGVAKKMARALEARGVIVRPLDAMGDPESIRITIGLEAENQQVIDALKFVSQASRP